MSQREHEILEKVKKMLSSLPKPPDNVHSFAVKTTVPYEMELASDQAIIEQGQARHVKNLINTYIKERIVELYHLSYKASEGEWVIEINLEKEKVNSYLANLFVFGYYYKEKPGLSQTRWTCRKCGGKGCERCNFKGKMYLSVEDIIKEKITALTNCKDVVLHASGREDVDVTNLAGRPCVLELVKPQRKPPIHVLAKSLQESSLGVWVDVKKYVKRSTVKLVADSHFDKVYWVETDAEISEEEKQAIEALKNIEIRQRTPKRVAHRRADLVRERKILNITVLNTSPLTFVVEVEPGTYVKELVHGDEGRTEPSISNILGRAVQCIGLKLIAIHDDFLTDVLNVRRKHNNPYYRIKRVGEKTKAFFTKHAEKMYPELREKVAKYISDGDYFFEKGDLPTALGCYDYAFGLVEGYKKALEVNRPRGLHVANENRLDA